MKEDEKMISPGDAEILQICMSGATYAEIVSKIGDERFKGFMTRIKPYIEVGGTREKHIVTTNQAGKRYLEARGLAAGV